MKRSGIVEFRVWFLMEGFHVCPWTDTDAVL